MGVSVNPRNWRISVTLVAAAALVLPAAFGTASSSGYTVQPGISYALNSPADPALNQLDLYLPDGAAAGDLRPVMVYAHGGGWMNGDKDNKITSKAKLFTDAGYLFASVNYRLSPDAVPGSYPSGRIMFPDHPLDVGESVAWIGDDIAEYGGDPDALVLIGHSAGAHLVALVGTDPSYLNGFGTSLRQVLGVVPLDAGALDVVDSATQTRPQPTRNNYLIWNAFGSPAEEAVTPRWSQASPVNFAGAADPRELLVTQAAAPNRIADNQKMAAALGQDPNGVLRVPLDHEGINSELGSPTDSTGETAAVMAFISGRIASRTDPKASIRKRPARVVRAGRKRSGKLKKRKVRFAFTGAGVTEGFQCRIDRRAFTACKSPRKYRVGKGKHRFRVRPLYPSGRPGGEKLFRFKVKAKHVKHKRGKRHKKRYR